MFFSEGFKVILHAHTAETEATVSKVFQTTDRDGKIMKKPFATVGMAVICKFDLAKPVPCERFDDARYLGRVILRTGDKTCAVGVITKLPPNRE